MFLEITRTKYLFDDRFLIFRKNVLIMIQNKTKRVHGWYHDFFLSAILKKAVLLVYKLI